MADIFLSYRRGDGGHAGRVRDRLRAAFGADSTFVDVDSIHPGDDFGDQIAHALDCARVLVVVVGLGWHRESIEQRRIHGASDYVRKEIAVALARNLIVIPTLVGGACLPNAQELPFDTRGLVDKQACELSDTRWDFDIGQLVATIARSISRQPFAAPQSRNWKPVGLFTALSAGGVALMAILIVALFPKSTVMPPRMGSSSEAMRDSDANLEPSRIPAPATSGARAEPTPAGDHGSGLGSRPAVAAGVLGETTLLGVSLSTASRETLRRALAKSGAPFKRTHDDLFDVFDSRKLMQESTELELGFVADGHFARGKYTFPSELDVEQVDRIAKIVAEKYQTPPESSGILSVGKVSFTWIRPDGIRIVVHRGWPRTETYLEYHHPTFSKALDEELSSREAQRVRETAKRHADSF